MKPYERDAIEQHRIDLQHELGIVKSELSFNNGICHSRIDDIHRSILQLHNKMDALLSIRPDEKYQQEVEEKIVKNVLQ